MNFTTSLPSGLLAELDDYAKKFRVPKSRILEQALSLYFNRLKKAEYIRSFQRAASDDEVNNMAEEGLEDYLKMLGEE